MEAEGLRYVRTTKKQKEGADPDGSTKIDKY